MLQASKVEHSYTTVRAAAHEDINTVSTETHVEDLLIMRNELGLGSQRWYVPYGTCGIDTRGDDKAWRASVPVQ